MSVIDTATNTVTGDPITVGVGPVGVAFTPDGRYAYIPNFGDDTVSVITTATITPGGNGGNGGRGGLFGRGGTGGTGGTGATSGISGTPNTQNGTNGINGANGGL